MTVIPQCFDCRHLDRQAGRMACSAFPGGIPEPILLADHDHHEPYPGDRGIRFEPDPRSGLETGVGEEPDPPPEG